MRASNMCIILFFYIQNNYRRTAALQSCSGQVVCGQAGVRAHTHEHTPSLIQCKVIYTSPLIPCLNVCSKSFLLHYFSHYPERA